MPRNWLWIATLPVLFALGCGAGGAPAPTPVTPSADVESRHAVLVAEGDAAWVQRADRDALRNAIAKWEAARYLRPNDWKTAQKLGRAYELLGQWLRIDGDTEGSLAAFKSGMEEADEGMRAQNGEYDKKRRLGVEPYTAIELIDREGIGLVYWYTANWAIWMRIKGSKTAFALRKKIAAMASHVYEVEPDYFYRGADRFFGTYYALLPSEVGGDLEKSRAHFQDAIKKAPQNLETFVFMADIALRQEPDPPGFDKLIDTVLQAEPCAPDNHNAHCIPDDLAPEQDLFVHRAKYLKSKHATKKAAAR